MRNLICILLVLSASAQAQVYKCTEAGKTTYSNTPCPGGTTVLPIDTTPRQTKSDAGGNSYDRELRALIARSLSEGDFKKAESLAVTEGHWQMIEAAKDRKAQAAADKKKDRGIVCASGRFGPTTVTRCR